MESTNIMITNTNILCDSLEKNSYRHNRASNFFMIMEDFTNEKSVFKWKSRKNNVAVWTIISRDVLLCYKIDVQSL